MVAADKELSPWKNVLYSGLGGVSGAASVFPLDFAKTQLQMDKAGKFKGPFHVMRDTVSRSGAVGLYRGLGANLIGIMPEKTIKLCANDMFRQYFGVDKPGGASVPLECLAGGMAGGLQIIVTTPMEITKIQLQMDKGGQNQMAVLREMVRKMGITGLYQGTVATGMRDVPFSMIYFGIYGQLRRQQADPETNKVSTLGALVSSTVAGMIGASITNPLDVIKTRMQAADAPKGESWLGCVNRVVAEEGQGALWKGIGPRTLILAPLFGIALMVKETLARISP